MTRAWCDWPEDPLREQLRPGDRVKFRRQRGMILDAWISGDSLTGMRLEFVRVELDNCKKITCGAEEVRRI